MNATTIEANPDRFEVSAKATLRHSLVLLDAIVRNERSQVSRESERRWRWNVSDAAKLVAMMWSDSPDPQREAVRLLAVATKVAEQEQCGQLDEAISYFTLRRAALGSLIFDGMGVLPQTHDPRPIETATPLVRLDVAKGLFAQWRDNYAPAAALPFVLSADRDMESALFILGSTGTGMTSRVIRPVVKPWLAENAVANRKKKRR
jgi:hypothetical protein